MKKTGKVLYLSLSLLKTRVQDTCRYSVDLVRIPYNRYTEYAILLLMYIEANLNMPQIPKGFQWPRISRKCVNQHFIG